MSGASFGIDIQGAEQQARELGLTDRQVTRALRSATDKTTRAARGIIVDAIAEETRAKPAALRKVIVVSERTTQSRLSAEVTVLDKPMLVKDLGPEVIKSTGSVLLDRSAVPGQGPEKLQFAFKPTKKKGVYRRPSQPPPKRWPRGAIFERKIVGGSRSQRYPLTSARGPSAAKLVEPILTPVAVQIQARLNEEFQAAFDKFRGDGDG